MGVLWELKQELYFVGQNYEIFIIEFSAREKLKQNNAGDWVKSVFSS